MSWKAKKPRILEPEDVLLGLWMLAVEQWVVRYSGQSPLAWTAPREDGSWPWTLVAVLLAAAFVIFTRGSLDTSIDRALKRRILIFPPLFFVLPLIASIVSLIRGDEKSVVRRGGEEAEWPMPTVPDWLRRLVATPLFLIGDSVFLAAFESEQKSYLASEFSPSLADLTLTFLLVTLPFLISVAGPRIAAGSSGDWKIWLGRFALYAVLFVSGRQLVLGGFF